MEFEYVVLASHSIIALHVPVRGGVHSSVINDEFELLSYFYINLNFI